MPWPLRVPASSRVGYCGGCDGRNLRHAQAARALRAHEALVAGEAEDADVLRAQIDGEHACRLRRVDHEQQSVRCAERADARQIKQIPRQI